MSTNSETPIQACQQGDLCPPPAGLQPAEDHAVAAQTMTPVSATLTGEPLTGEGPAVEGLTGEGPAGCDPQTPFPRAVRVTAWPQPPRPPKSALLPEIARLAMEGHSDRAISRQLGVPRRTVDRWIGELRKQWDEKAAASSEGLGGLVTVRLEAVYREAMQAWRRSLADKQVTVESPGSDNDAQPKRTRRTTTQSGQAALLGKAMQSAKEISKVQTQQRSQARADRASRERVEQPRETYEQARERMFARRNAAMKAIDEGLK